MRGILLAAAVAAAAAAPAVQLDAWGRDSIRVRIAPPGSPGIVEPPLMALLPTPPSVADVPIVGLTSLQQGNLIVSYDAASGFITATRVSDGVVLLQTVNITWGAPAAASRPKAVSANITFAGHPGEAVYGLGEHRNGVVNQIGFSQTFTTDQDYSISHGADSTIPYYGSSLGYGFLWNLPSYGAVALTNTSLSWSSVATQNIDFWITTTTPGIDAKQTSIYADMLSKMVDAVGHAPAMPSYATGFIQCKDRYRNQTQLMDVARGYVTRGLPISTIVIDWKHWVAQGDWTLNPQCWPDPQGMVDELASMGIELMITFWPFQSLESQHWQEYADNGYLATNLTGGVISFDGSDQYLVDQINPVARNATFWNWYEGYGQLGVKAVWMDAAEPERNGEESFGQWKFGSGAYTDNEVGMAWTQQHVRMFADGAPSIGLNISDMLLLPRHVWAGSWHYGAALWSGDIVSAFSELELQIRAVQGVVMSGQVLWTTDIGGYANGDPTDPVFQELIVRWFQFGAFCPLFRLHGHRAGGPPADECGPTNGDNEVWNLAADAAHYQGITSVMYLRENLRGYVASINAEAAATGMPMLRPMILSFPGDPVCATSAVEGQFMFGPDWLVAPITTYQATNWTAYLPPLDANHTWIYWWNQTDVGAGGQWVTVNTPITEFPLFFRRPVTPAPPPVLGNVTSFFSAVRQDQVACLTSQCYSVNVDQDGYAQQFVDSVGVVSSSTNTIEVNGATFPVVPLNLFFSFPHNDNFIATNTTAPDDTYTITFSNGYVLATQAPGSVPLEVWFKQYNATSWDYASVSSPQGLAWVKDNGYTFQFVTGYVLPAPSA